MALDTGSKLGPYEIVSPAGAGGMGEVYRARDTRLERTVAIKVLPAHLISSAEVKMRFEREARAISQLQHPHICVLHDIGRDDASGTDYLVLEFLDGETLSERLKKGPLPLEQVLKIGTEVADALEKAHRQGIIHRDLKPGNIMLTKSGAKLMDFGLAKPGLTAAGAASGTAFTAGVTLTSPVSPLTTQGTIVGTFQYMSPEQLEGKEADSRSDLFAFGAVLYEMLTGKRAFEGKSQISVMSAILEKDPEPVSSIQPLTPPALDYLVRACLAKDPEERIQTAHDVLLQLRFAAEQGAPAAVAGSFSEKGATWRRQVIPWAAAALCLIVAAVLATAYYRSRSDQPVVRASILAPPDATFYFNGDTGGAPVLSPDGTKLVFSARVKNGGYSLWIRPLNSSVAQHLDGTEGAANPFWSADSKYIGFFAERKMKKIAATGGPITSITDAPNARGGSWGADNTILFTPDFRSNIQRVNASGGTPVDVTHLDTSLHSTHRWPWWLPDGKHFLYYATIHAGGNPEKNGIYFASVDGKENRLVLASDAAAQFVAGYLLFFSQGNLTAQAFDPSSGKLSGDAVPIVEQVQFDSSVWRAVFSVSQNGELVYQTGAPQLGSNLIWFDRTGKELGRIGQTSRYFGFRISPEGRRLAVATGDPRWNISVMDLDRGTTSQLTFDEATHIDPIWSPDGKWIVYDVVSSTTGQLFGLSIHRKAASGLGKEEVLLQADSATGGSLSAQDWTKDGKYLVYLENHGPSGQKAMALPMVGDRKPFLVLQPQNPQANIASARVSPDGKWMSYASNESGRYELFVTNFPQPMGKWQVSTSLGAVFATWSHDGKRLYFQDDSGYVNEVEVTAGSGDIRLSQPKRLFSFVNPGFSGAAPFELSVDDKRILTENTPGDASAPISLVLNWTRLLAK